MESQNNQNTSRNNTMETAFDAALLIGISRPDKSFTQERFQFTIYHNKRTYFVRIRLINCSNERESYTGDISPDIFHRMKEEQKLTIEYSDFSKELKHILSKIQERGIRVILRIGEEIKITFSILVEIKELTLLEIPLQKTHTEEIITYFINKAVHLKEVCDSLTVKNSRLEKDKVELEQKNKSQLEKIQEKYKQSETTFERKIEDLEKQVEEKESVIIDYIREKDELNESRNSLKDENNILKSLAQENGKEIEKMRDAIIFYRNKCENLEEELITKKETTVPKEKYELLGNVFSTALADLIKSQVKLFEVVTANDMQANKNRVLTKELAKSSETIKKLEQNFHKNVNEEDDMPDVSKLIAKLQFQNKQAELANLKLQKQYEEKQQHKHLL